MSTPPWTLFHVAISIYECHLAPSLVLDHPDEDISNSDLIVLTTSKLMVKPFYKGFIFNRCYDLMLQPEVCTFSFSKLRTWIKRGLDCIWTAWRVNEVDWGPSPSTPNVLHQATTITIGSRK
jgi:hypothetical protein